MALSASQIIAVAGRLLAEHGLGGLTMRRLADALGVQPGAIYHHVASKQELLVAVADALLAGVEVHPEDPGRTLTAIRAALGPVRDGAEVVSFAQAFRPDALAGLAELPRCFGGLGDPEATWAAQTLVHYVLGFVAREQNEAELVRARILTRGTDLGERDRAFAFGLAAILAGLSGGAASGAAGIATGRGPAG